MTEDEVLELLEEARQSCGRKADKLAEFCGARVPNEEKVARFVIEGHIQRFTGKRVTLPLREEPETVVKQSGQIDEKLTSALSGCSWCGADEVLIGGVVATWAYERKLFACRACAARGVEELESFLCQVCRLPIAVGEWGCITTIRPHAKSVQTDPFVTYFDYGLGKEITSLGDRWQAMKAEPGDAHVDGRGRLEYRDKVKKGDLSARRDRDHQHKQEQRRRERGCVAERDTSEVSHPDSVTVFDDRPAVLYDGRDRPLQRRIGFRG